jgi:hypothetical protein
MRTSAIRQAGACGRPCAGILLPTQKHARRTRLFQQALQRAPHQFVVVDNGDE